ncbi:nucleotide exchange factor GrpE [Waterburya agarophytonicola K14]|uniref:Nucleotide exchange factor GrpE n=1 Tax=Waterburya agarophytonicola KI4 TaxID=2874699 RepID=A0A964BQU3_9CYAN|nr:nucleotide exchange factor GrpE [Waterburya agarophytonicola KI4]
MFQLDKSQRDRLQQELGSLLKEKMSLKQVLKQQKQQTEQEQEELFLELLEVFDSLEFFLNYIKENPKPNSKFYQRLPKSLRTIQKKILSILNKRQVQLIELKDNKPDYSICQVVDREAREDLEEETITKVVRQGFKVESKILRPTEVIISKKLSL